MTYKTRQEVLRAAADWMDVCEKDGVTPTCKVEGRILELSGCSFDRTDHDYEFPLALLEGKEVWVGSELYNGNGKKFIAEEFIDGYFCEAGYSVRGYGFSTLAESCSWNPPKPKTVMVELPVKAAEIIVSGQDCSMEEWRHAQMSCKKALESLK